MNRARTAHLAWTARAALAALLLSAAACAHEDTLGTNILQGGAVINQTGTPTQVPAGAFGFPQP